MAQVSNQIQLDFKHIDEKGLKKVLTAFKKDACPVTEVEANNIPKRENGSPVKSFTLTFEDGQKVFCKVKADGTVFQVKLNNKVVPIKNVDNMDKAVHEIADYVGQNAKAYARAKINREKRLKKPPVVKVVTTRKMQIDVKQSELTKINEDNAGLEAQLKEYGTDEVSAQLEKAKKDLESELQRTDDLNTAIAELQKEIGGNV